MKESFYSFLNSISDIDTYINLFWDEKTKKISDWYYCNYNCSDIIISASPDFLIGEIGKRLNVNMVIASKVDKFTGKLLGPNCFGVEKVKRFKAEIGDKHIDNFYTDSLSDLPMMIISDKAFIVSSKRIKPFKL